MKTRFTLKYLFLMLLLSFSSEKVLAQCFQIESILVAACVPAANPNSEGYNEMVRFRIGAAPVNTSTLNVNWPAQAWQGLIQNTTTQAAVASINANIQAAGSCHQLIEPVGGVIPANAAVVLVTSQNFSSSSNVFGALTEDVYIIFQDNTTVTAGHFGNYNVTPGIRTLSMNFGGGCSDTVSYERSSLANGAGASVNFTAAGAQTYPQNPSCVAPVAVYTVDAGAGQTVCPGDTVALTGTTNAPVIDGWTAPSGTFSSPTTLATNYTVPSNATGTIVLTLAVKGGTCTTTTITDTVTLTVGSAVTPTFNAVGPFCSGATIAALPTQSTNTTPINGTWSPALNNTATTTYTFTPTAGQCAATATLTITINQPVTPTFNAVAPICTGSPLSALPTQSTNTTPINGTWSPALDNTTTTTYTFTPAAGQCATTTTLTITVNAANTVPTFTAVGPFCSGTTIPALPTTSNNLITGTWSPAIDNTTTTTYTFTPNPNQCAVSTTLVITITPNVVPTFNPIANVCTGTTITLPTTSTNGATGTWAPVFNNTTTTTYTFTPTSGCFTTTTLTVGITPSTTPTFTAVAPICAGATLSALPTTSTNGITGTWSPALNNATTTTYTFTPATGQCASIATMTINVNPLVTPTFTAVPAACIGSTLSALPTTSNNAITGTWAPALNNTATTIYTFTPTAGQCANSVQMTIVINSLVTPTFNAVPAVCAGNTIAPLPTTSTNGFTGTWSPALNNTATTIYTFTPTAGQCASNTTLTITITPPSVTPAFNPVSAICQGGFLAPLPTTSTNGITGSWSPALNNNATTTYTFVPNPGQCAVNTTLTITITPPSVTPTFNSVAPICTGAALAPLPTTSLQGILGVWSPALNNTATTTYTFTPNQGQCGLTTTLTITVNALTIPTFSPVSPYCRGSLIALPTNSTNGISGSWSPPFNNTVTTTYTFTPFPGQCAATTTVTIPINQPTLPTFNPVAAVCSGTTIAALPTTSTNGVFGTWSPAINNTATTVYTFTPNPGQCASVTTLTITVSPGVTPTFTLPAGICVGGVFPTLPTTSNNGVSGTWSPAPNTTTTTTYTFTPNVGQCAAVITRTIAIFPNIIPTFTPVLAVCYGAAIAPLPTTSNNLIVGTWSPAINNTATTTYTFTPDPSVGSCAVTTTMTINVNPLTIPLFDPTTIPVTVCEGDPIAALPTFSQNGISGTWSPAINNIATTTYVFTPDAGQCADINALTINVTPNLQESKSYHLCVDASGNVINPTRIETGLSPALYSFEWTFAGSTIPHTGDSYLIDAAGIYTVVATNLALGCKTNTITAEVFFIKPATAIATITNEFESVQQIVVTVSGGISPAYYEYQLENGPWQTSNTFEITQGGDYTIQVRDNIGCNSFELKVTALNYPKFFTPNGDGYNDTWNIEGLLPSQKGELFIFDRYGKLIKQISPYGTGWDGTYNGAEMPGTDYWFKLLYLDKYGTPKEFKSHFSLKR